MLLQNEDAQSIREPDFQEDFMGEIYEKRGNNTAIYTLQKQGSLKIEDLLSYAKDH